MGARLLKKQESGGAAAAAGVGGLRGTGGEPLAAAEGLGAAGRVGAVWRRVPLEAPPGARVARPWVHRLPLTWLPGSPRWVSRGEGVPQADPGFWFLGFVFFKVKITSAEGKREAVCCGALFLWDLWHRPPRRSSGQAQRESS